MAPKTKNYNQVAGQNKQRIEALADGVFAVAMTLLVLDIKVPMSETILSEKDLIYAFLALLPKFLTYLLSMVTLGVFWVAHSTAFHYLKKTDRDLCWINIFFFLFISLLPFSTAFLSEHITFKFAIAVYWMNLALLGATMYVNWTYADKHNLLSIEGDEKIEIGRALKVRIIQAQILNALAISLCFVNTYLSIGLIIILQLNFALGIFRIFPRDRKKKHRPEQER